MSRWLARACLLALATATGCQHDGGHEPVRVGAAASLRRAMPALSEAFHRRSGVHVSITYGASWDLASAVERGTELDAVVLASGASVDRLIQGGHADAGSRRELARNGLVLVSRDAASNIRFATMNKLRPGTRVGLGDPKSVPAGRYARRYLTSIGVWNAMQPYAIYGGDVAVVLAMALRGEVSVAIVYRTDAREAGGVTVLDTATGPSAPVPTVVGATVHGAHRRGPAGRFLAFVASPEGQKILQRYGFEPAS